MIQEKKAQLQKKEDETLFLVWRWPGFEVATMQIKKSDFDETSLVISPVNKKYMICKSLFEITMGLFVDDPD